MGVTKSLSHTHINSKFLTSIPVCFKCESPLHRKFAWRSFQAQIKEQPSSLSRAVSRKVMNLNVPCPSDTSMLTCG